MIEEFCYRTILVSYESHWQFMETHLKTVGLRLAPFPDDLQPEDDCSPREYFIVLDGAVT